VNQLTQCPEQPAGEQYAPSDLDEEIVVVGLEFEGSDGERDRIDLRDYGHKSPGVRVHAFGHIAVRQLRESVSVGVDEGNSFLGRTDSLCRRPGRFHATPQDLLTPICFAEIAEAEEADGIGIFAE
jgi:hypothetical protein